MPRSFKFERQDIVSAALAITRESGFQAVTARAVCDRLGSSTKPIFGLFRNMDEVGAAVIKAAYEIYDGYIKEGMNSGKYPPYKASGMAYIRFAREEKELFRLLFMRDRSNEPRVDDRDNIRPIIEIIKTGLNVDTDTAYRFHLEMWIYVHGIAAMIATSYLDWDEQFASDVLTDAYEGIKCRFNNSVKGDEK